MTKISIAIDDASAASIQNYLDAQNQKTGNTLAIDEFLTQRFSVVIQSICNQAVAISIPKAAQVTIALSVDSQLGAPVETGVAGSKIIP